MDKVDVLIMVVIVGFGSNIAGLYAVGRILERIEAALNRQAR